MKPGIAVIGLALLMGMGCTQSAKDNNVIAGPDMSGMPVPQTNGVPRPSGVAGNLQVLDWAGFQGALSYTFDDGQPSQLEHYEALNATGVRMTFFVSTFNSRYDSFDSVFSKAVLDGHELGNHTHYHCRTDLVQCAFGDTPPVSVEADIETCNSYIADHLGQPSTCSMAAPYGDMGWENPSKDYFLLNRTVNDGTVAPRAGNPVRLPSYMVDTSETAKEILNPRISTTRDAGEWLIFTFHGISPTKEKWYPLVDIEEITASINYAKTFGDVWMDTMGNIGAYWVAQKMFSELIPAANGAEVVWTWTLPDFFPEGKFLRVTVDGGTLSQKGTPLNWSAHGYYEVNLDVNELTLQP